MREKLIALVDVQEIDLRIASLLQEKELLPCQFQELSQALKYEEEKKNAIEKEIQDLVKDRRQKERDLEEKNEARKKFQEQLYQLKSNKEYTALIHEIENIKKEIDKLEEDILILMEKIEEKERDIIKEKNNLEEKKIELEQLSMKNAEEIARLEGKLKEFEREREEKSAGIPQDLLSRYERICQAREGVGIAAIRNNACQGCFMALPPQVISEAKLGQRLITCESCNRLLYIV